MAKTKFEVNWDYEERANYWRAEGEAADEKGNQAKAERCFAKCQYWLDKANKVRGWGE